MPPSVPERRWLLILNRVLKGTLVGVGTGDPPALHETAVDDQEQDRAAKREEEGGNCLPRIDQIVGIDEAEESCQDAAADRAEDPQRDRLPDRERIGAWYSETRERPDDQTRDENADERTEHGASSTPLGPTRTSGERRLGGSAQEALGGAGARPRRLDLAVARGRCRHESFE